VNPTLIIEDLPYLYWIPKLHKTPYKERYIAGSSTFSTKELSIHLAKILSAVKYKHNIVGSLVRRNDNIFVLKRGKTLNSFLVFKYRLR
jgi:hypothetical protein